MVVSYLSYLKATRKSENTIRSYTKNIQKMLDTIGKNEEDIVYSDLVDYQASLSNLSANSVRLHIAAIQSYFGYLYKSNVIQFNPANSLEKPKANPKVKPYMTEGMIKAMVAHARTSRDRAIVDCICSTGVRISELVNITLEDYYKARYDSREIVILGKGDKERVIYLNDELIELIDIYLKDRGSTSCPYLFSSFQDGQIHSNNLSQTLKNIAKRAGIPFWEDISNHTLRAAFATIASEKNVPVATIKDAMGHASIATTSIYIKNSQRNINRAMECMCFS